MAWDNYICEALSATQQRDYAVAEHLLKQALQYAKDNFARNDSRFTLSLSLLAHAYYQVGEIGRAERLLDQSLRLQTTAGARVIEPCLIMDTFVLSQIKLASHKYADTCRLYNDAVAVLSDADDNTPAGRARVYFIDRWPEVSARVAEEELQSQPEPAAGESAAGAQPTPQQEGDSMSDLWERQLNTGLNGLSVDDEEQESWVTAYLNLESALRLGRQLFEAGDARLISNLKLLADAATKLRLQEVAEPLYREAILAARRYPHSHVNISELRLSLALMYSHFELFKQAKKIIDEESAGGAVCEQRLPKRLFGDIEQTREQIRIYDSVQALLRQAQSAEDQADLEKAVKLSNTALSQLRQGFPPSHPEQARVLRYRAHVLEAAGKQEQAQELAQRAERIQRSHDGLCDRWSKITSDLPRPEVDGVAV